MTQIEPYRPPPDATAFPLRLEVNGATYVLAQGDGHQLDAYGYQQTARLPVLNGVPQTWTPNGYQPYHAHPASPPWLRNHYTRGTGLLIGAACIGTVLAVVAIAIYAVVVAAIAHALAIGVALLVVFVGLMILLRGGLAYSRHGHPIPRR